MANNNPTYLPVPAQPGPKSDNKFADVLVQHPQKMTALSQSLRDPNNPNNLQKPPLVSQFAQIIRNAMNYVQEAFPIVEKQILEALLTEDQRDIALRAFSNCMRFILK